MVNNSQVVCIIDDDNSMLRALGRLVRTFGYEVKLFPSGQQFLDTRDVENAACLIIDVSMPDMNGFELRHWLTAAGHAVPTVFVSAHNDDAVKERAKLAGAITVLSKPFEAELLHDTLKKAIATT